MTKQEAEYAFEKIDTDGDGDIRFDDFSISTMGNYMMADKLLREAFNQMD